MKRIVAVLALGFILLAQIPARSDDTPYLDVVRALRARGYNEEAYEFLEKLPSRNPPKDVLAFIPLEKGISLVSHAMQTPDAVQRASLLNQAGDQFDAIIKSQPQGPFGAIATLEKARGRAYLGRVQTVKARLAKKEGNEKGEMEKALAMFLDAQKDLAAADGLLDAALKKENSKAIDAALKQAKLQSEFELAANLLDQAITYDALNKNGKERGDLIDKAVKDLGALYEKDNKGTVGWQARAWRGRGESEVSQIDAAIKDFRACEDKDETYAETGRRQAMMFHFLLPLIHPDEKTNMSLKDIRDLGEKWLKDYPAFANTFEGNYIRFEVANIYKDEGMKIVGDKPNPPKDKIDKAKPMLEKAAAYFNEIASTENEFKIDANAGKFDILFLISETVKITMEDIEKLKGFDELLQMVDTIALQLDKESANIARLTRDAKTPEDEKKLEQMKKEFPDYRKAQYGKLEYALTRALDLADVKTKPEKVGEARGKLIYVLIENGNPYRAAIIGEHIARIAAQKKGGSDAVQAASYALMAYSAILAEDATAGLDKAIIDADRDRLKSLAKLMEDNWPKASETNTARYQIGAMLLRDEKLVEAEEMLSRVTDAYPPADLTQARYWWAIAASRLAHEKDLPDVKKNHYKEQVVKALKGVPETLPNDVSQQTATAYVLAKLQFANVLYEAKKFDELDKLGLSLKDRINKFQLEDKFKDATLKQADVLSYLAAFGRANTDLASGKYKPALDSANKVLPVVKATLDQVREPEKKARERYNAGEKALEKFGYDPKNPEKVIERDKLSEAQQKEYDKVLEDMKDAADVINEVAKESNRYAELYRGLLILALRACVLDNNPALAKRYFTDLRKAAKDEGGGTAIYVGMVAQIRKQIEDLKAQGGKEKEVLSLQRNFASLLKNLEAEPELNPEKIFDRPEDKKNEPELPHVGLIFFLIESYSNIEDHDSAIAILTKIPKPKVDPGQAAAVRQKDEGIYHFARRRLAKELRLAGAKDPKRFTEAEKLLDEIQAQDWGKDLEPKKERAHLAYDKKEFGNASRQWGKIVSDFGQKPDFTKAKVREEYFEAMYHFLDCKYKYATLKDDPRTAAETKANKPTIEEKRAQYISEVAKKIVEMEANINATDFFRQKIEEMVKANEPLRKAYEEAKKDKGPATAAK